MFVAEVVVFQWAVALFVIYLRPIASAAVGAVPRERAARFLTHFVPLALRRPRPTNGASHEGPETLSKPPFYWTSPHSDARCQSFLL